MSVLPLRRPVWLLACAALLLPTAAWPALASAPLVLASQAGANLPSAMPGGWALLPLLLLLYLLHRWRVRQLILRTEQQLAERERHAWALHDTLRQSMQGLTLRMQALVDQIKDDPVLTQRFLGTLDQADVVLADGREPDLDLPYPGPSDDDLGAALEHVATAMRAIHAVPFTLTVAGHRSLQLQSAARDEAFAIAREALLNAYRHASAQCVEIEIIYGADAFRLFVRDDGDGLSANATPPPPLRRDPQGGIETMRARAQRIEAVLQLWSGVGRGTEVSLSIPCRRAYRQPWRRWHGRTD
ncbi:hypothetical protein JCM19000A_26880 [Silvimonas sp. JCM 19000]